MKQIRQAEMENEGIEARRDDNDTRNDYRDASNLTTTENNRATASNIAAEAKGGKAMADNLTAEAKGGKTRMEEGGSKPEVVAKEGTSATANERTTTSIGQG